MQNGSRTPRRGFTFVELMIVITIILILIAAAIPMYNRAILRAHETVLRSNLFTLRTVIARYSYDNARGPQSLQELVNAGYLRAIPKDPITNSTDWKTRTGDADSAADQSEPGIAEVHSGSDQRGLDGRPYAEW
jgi:general secretion pathway protein G